MAVLWLTPPPLLSSCFCPFFAVYYYLLLQRPNFTWIISSEALPLCPTLLAPPSAPRIYLQIPPDPQTGQRALLCLTRGFHPSELTLSWSYRSAAADIDHLSVTNCTLPAIDPHGNLSEHPADGALLSSDWLVNSMPPRTAKVFQDEWLTQPRRVPECFSSRWNRNRFHMLGAGPPCHEQDPDPCK